MNKVDDNILTADVLECFVNSNWGYEQSLLHRAVLQNDFKLVKQCIQLNVNVNKIDEYGCTALFYCKSLEMAKILVGNGLDVNILDIRGKTAVVSHYRGKNNDIIEYLAKITDLDLEGRKNDSSTLLHQMISNQELDKSLFEIVIPRTKDINRLDSYSDSYLMHAARRSKYLDIILMLVESGIDLYIRNKLGENFYDLSFKYVRKEIEKKYPEFMKYKNLPESQRIFKLKQLSKISE